MPNNFYESPKKAYKYNNKLYELYIDRKGNLPIYYLYTFYSPLFG